MRVVPALDEVEDGESRFALSLEPMLHEQLALERRVKAFAHRVVVAISDRSHRRKDSRFFAALAERNGRILRALVGMMHHAPWLAAIDRHVERVEDEFFAHMIGHGPADDAAAIHVENHRKEQEAGPRRHVRDVGDPELICALCCGTCERPDPELAAPSCRARSSPRISGAKHRTVRVRASIALHAYRRPRCRRLGAQREPVVARTLSGTGDRSIPRDRPAARRSAGAGTACACATRNSRSRRQRDCGTARRRDTWLDALSRIRRLPRNHIGLPSEPSRGF